MEQWINLLTGLSQNTRQYIGNPRVFSNGSRVLGEYFLTHFYQAYLYFVNLSKANNPNSGSTFFAFLNNLISAQLSLFARWYQSLKQLSWLSYFPGANLKSIGSENADLTLILDLDENNLDIEKMSEKQLNFWLNRSGKAYVYAASNLWNLPYRENFIKLYETVKQKDFWTRLDTVLKNNLGIKSLLFNNEEYSLENLISSSSQFDDHDSGWFIFKDLNTPSKIELMKIIFGNKRSIDQGIKDANQLHDRFEETKRKLLTDLQTALETLQKVDPTTVRFPINGKNYTIDELLQARTQLLNDQLDQKVIDQIKQLFSHSIYATDITKVTNQLAKYKEIITFLTKLTTDKKIEKLTIKDQDYSFTSLLTDANRQFVDFAKDSLDELQKLVEGKITLSQLKTAYQESLRSSATKSPTKKSTNQNLAIGLGTAGGVLALAGAGGFAYWFLKIRKN